MKYIKFENNLITADNSWSWEGDAVKFYQDNYYFFTIIAILYYPTIFGIRYLMTDAEPYDLGGAKSKGFNWIFWWEVGLAVFSILGMYHTVPMMLAPIFEGSSLTEAVCMDGVHDDPRNLWVFFFMVSKVFEFGDTIFVVLRKKPLILLQHYHHLATMLYCWYGTLTTFSYNNTNVFFAGMNLTVHSIMYSWYAATRTGWRSPKWLMMFVTLLQLVQMIFGVTIIYLSVRGDHESCGKWEKEDIWGLRACFFMYFSYLILFSKLFYDNYCTKRKKKKKQI